MQLSFKPARLTGFAILAVAGATALSVGACSSHNDKSSEKSPPASANGADSVSGLVASVSGSTVEVTQENGTAKVDVGPSAKVTEFTEAKLSDVAAGNCVNVDSTSFSTGPGGAVTAKIVRLNPQGSDGKCAQPKNAKPPRVIGTVASVEGNTINVTVTDANGKPSETHVAVADTTRYSKSASATSQAIAQGKCVTAGGTKDGGTLKATSIALGPATDGKCPQFAAATQKPR
jgi:hypothetical protein